MLVIRFLRVGKRNQPSFRIVVTEKKRAAKSGRFIEKVGFYNPLTRTKGFNTERIKYWLSVGAKPSDTVWNLLVAEKIVEGKKISVHAKTEIKEEAEKAPSTLSATSDAESKAEAAATKEDKSE